MQQIAPYLKEWRKFRKLTLEFVGGRIDLDPSTLSRIERGDISYTRPNIEALAVLYRCRPVDLFLPPGSSLIGDLSDEVATIVRSLDSEQQDQVARILRAMFPQAA